MYGSPQLGYAAYKTSRRQALQSPEAILLALYEEICRALMAAKTAHEKKMLDEMCRHNARAIKILACLKSTLSFEAAGKDGRALDRYYGSLIAKISSVLRYEKPQVVFEITISDLVMLCQNLRNRTHIAEK